MHSKVNAIFSPIGANALSTAHVSTTWSVWKSIGFYVHPSKYHKPISRICPFIRVTFTGSVPFKMSATSMFPMCVRATRGLLSLRNGTTGGSVAAVTDLIRGLSTERPTTVEGSSTGGIAQAILQDRLQQQQKKQVSYYCSR